MDEVREILNQRRAHHGAFETHAQLAQTLKHVVREAGQNKQMDATQWEALDMILHKIARVMNGDPKHRDHWLDIAGYATLVADRLRDD